MSAPLRSHASVRSYFFRELVADNSDAAIEEFTLADYRIFWRWANNKALTWRRRATTIWNPATRQWEQRT